MNRPHALAAISAALFALVLAGCTDHPLAPTDTAALALERAGSTQYALVERPLRGHCETTFRPHPTQPPPPMVRQIDEGTCRLAHLGQSGFYSVKDINFATGTQTTTEATFTAANGDILRAEGSGTSAPCGPGRICFAATLTFAGGTGRFVDASGLALVEGEADLSAATASFEVVGGWITYDASDRSGS